eukprot:5676809-Amphidinium_carterae.1
MAIRQADSHPLDYQPEVKRREGKCATAGSPTSGVAHAKSTRSTGRHSTNTEGPHDSISKA